MSWKLSVAEFIPPFIRGAKYRTTLSADITAADATTLGVADTDARYYCMQGDILRMGPSTHNDNEGAVDQVILGDNNVVGIYTALPLLTTGGTNDFKYLTGDPVEAVGHAMPEGWTHSGSSDGVLTPLGIACKEGTSGALRGGFNTKLSGVWYALATGTTSYHYLNYYLRRKLLTGMTYRLGGYFKNTTHNGGTSLLSLYDNTTVVASANINGSYSDWTKVEATGAFTDTFLPDQNRIYLAWHYGTSFAYQGIDCIYLTHAGMTSAASSGVYTFPVNPDYIEEERGNRGLVEKLASGMPAYFDTLSYLPLRGYKLKFERGSAAFIKQLEILQYWQNSGNLLMLESDITGDRPIFGFMDFDFSFRTWDTSVINIDFVFKGI